LPSDSVTGSSLLTSSIFSPLVEINHESSGSVQDFKLKNNLVTQGTLITARNKNSEFTLWDLHPVLKNNGVPVKLHSIDTLGKSKLKKCFIDIKSNALFMLLKNKCVIVSMVTFGTVDVKQENGEMKKSLRFKKVYSDLISKKKDINSFTHFVSMVKIDNSASCYAKVYIRQGKQIKSYAMELGDEFEEAKNNYKVFEKFVNTKTNPQLIYDELTLEVNSNYMDSMQIDNNQDEQSQSNENEEAGDYRVNPDEDSDKDIHLNSKDIFNNDSLPRSKAVSNF